MEPQPAAAMEAEFEERPSLLSFALESVGWYIIPLLLTGIIGCVLAFIIVKRSKGPLAGAALLLIIHLPLFIGLFAALEGLLSFFMLFGWRPAKAEELVREAARGLVTPILALIVMSPSYAVAAVGDLIRALSTDADSERKRSV